MNLKTYVFKVSKLYKKLLPKSHLSVTILYSAGQLQEQGRRGKHRTAQKAMVFYEQVIFFSMHQKSKFLGISSSPSFVDVC